MSEAFVGFRTQVLREKRGWSRVELARKAGVSLSAIDKLERGETQPRRQTMRKLAEALETSAGYLMYGEEEAES